MTGLVSYQKHWSFNSILVNWLAKFRDGFVPRHDVRGWMTGQGKNFPSKKKYLWFTLFAAISI